MRSAVALAALALAVAACSAPPPAPPEPPPPAPVDSVVIAPPEPEPPVIEDTTAAEPEPTPEEVLLARVFDAMGGREAWRQVRAYSTEGTYAAQTTFGPTTIQTRSLVAGLRQIRAEQSTPVGDVLARVNGTSGTLLVDGAVSASGPAFVASVQSQLLFSLPYVLMNADSLAFSTHPDDPSRLVYEMPGLEATYTMTVGEDGRPTRIESRQPGTATVAHTLVAFREVGDLVIPATTRQTANGRATGEAAITAFTPNPEILPGAFGD